MIAAIITGLVLLFLLLFVNVVTVISLAALNDDLIELMEKVKK